MIIAIEGLDASGKNTQTKMLLQEINKRGLSAHSISFPRYGQTRFAKVVSDYLNGQFGDVKSVSPYLSSLLFAGDRFESLKILKDARKEYDVLILDRYVSSNIAYQAAKMSSDLRPEFISWLSYIEYELYVLPKADITLYLDIPVEISKQLASQRAPRTYTQKQLDIHESDSEYLLSCREVYLWLASREAGEKWEVIKCFDSNGKMKDQHNIAFEIWNCTKHHLFMP